MAIIERAIERLSPSWALRRQMARAMLAQYDGARVTRRTKDWRASGNGPNAESGPALDTLRNRSRDLTRNNPWAAAALDLHVAYSVGTGIIPRSATNDRALDRDADALFAAWAKRADWSGAHDLYGLQALAARSRAEAGETLAFLMPLTRGEARARGSGVPLGVQLAEPDLIDTAKDETRNDGSRIRNGIESDGAGRVRAIWMFEEHPGERDFLGRARTGASRRVPVANVLHVFRADRAGQVRGVPDIASQMTRLRLLDQLEDAALEAAKVQACLAAFVTSNQPVARGPLEAVDANGDPVKTFSPGMIERLMPGEDVKFVAPAGGGPFEMLTRHQLHAIAAGFGLTYDLLTGDLSQANYSSLRAGRLAFRRRLEQLQWLHLVPKLCEPIVQAFARAAQIEGLLPPRDGAWPFEHAPPRFEMVDPLKDTQAMILQERAGYATWDQNVAEMGWHPDRQAQDIADRNEERDRLGLIQDGDPRRVARAGGAQDARQNAAVEMQAE
jgi:lambda family phage portal protein